MKTKEELNELKEEVESLNKKLAELSEEELKQITGGQQQYDIHVYKNDKKEFNPNCSNDFSGGVIGEMPGGNQEVNKPSIEHVD